MKEPPKISIILINWNQKQDIAECIRSIERTEYTNYTITVVDNHSTDGSVAFLKEEFPRVRVRQNESNLGFCRANNQGIQEGLLEPTDYFFILNSDTIVERDLLAKLVSVMESDPSIGMAQPVFYYFKEPERIWHAGGTVALGRGRGPKASTRQVQSSGWYDSDFISGCGMFIRREVFEKAGLFDEDYFFLFEDVDLALRAKNLGYRLVTAAEASVWHKVSTSTGGASSPTHVYYYARNRLLFIKKNRTRPWYVYIPAEGILYIKTFLSLLLKHGNINGVYSLLKGVKDYSAGVRGRGGPSLKR